MERFGSACVLAGGAGRRMGRLDKLTVELGGERIVDRIVRILSPRFDDIIVVTARPEVFAGLGVRTVPDLVSMRGPLGGLHAALAASRSLWLYLTACDMPWQSLAWIDMLGARIERCEAERRARGEEEAVAAVARTGRFLEPFSAFYHRRAIGFVESALADGEEGATSLSLQSVLRKAKILGVAERERRGIDPQKRLFMSINTPEELVKARAKDSGAGVGINEEIL